MLKKIISFVISTVAVITLSTSVLAATAETNGTNTDLNNSNNQFQVIEKDLATGTITTKTIDKSATNIPGQTIFSKQAFIPPARTVSTINLLSKFFPGNPMLSTLMPNTVRTDRYQVADPTVFPYCAVCALHVTFSDGAYDDGTGFLVDNAVVVCCAHELYNDTDGYAHSISVTPGQNWGNQPFGVTYAKVFSVSPEYVSSLHSGNFDHSTDWAVFSTTDNIGTKTGYFGFEYNANSWQGTAARISGYPLNSYGNQFYCDGNIDFDSANELYYDNAAVSGMSGSPVYLPSYVAFGIHAYGPPDGDNNGPDTYNYGTKITSEVYNVIMQYRQ